MIELSVVMPARNASAYVDEAIQSILGQTFTDFELIVCDDNSSDDTLERLHCWAARDPRIRVFSSNHCNSPALAGNWAVGLARGALVARMDADDIAHPERLARQLAVLRRHPEAALVGALFEGIDAASRPIYGRDRSSLFREAFRAPAGHGVAMFRKAAFERIGGYRVACDYWEDFDLICRMATVGRILYLPDSLLQYRASAAHSRLRAQDSKVGAIDRSVLRLRRAFRGAWRV